MSSSQKEDLKELVERYEEWESTRTSSASSDSTSSGNRIPHSEIYQLTKFRNRLAAFLEAEKCDPPRTS